MSGIVYLVGAGPGDPGLLTLRGAECLARADLVLYDGLVNPLLLRQTSAQCERTSRVRHDGSPRVEQEDVNQKLIDAARAGKTVVRLKGGDPFLFGRGSEEAAALAAAGIPFEVVPGVTAAIAAGEYAGISLTHRQLASAVAFITGHEDPGKSEGLLDYGALAKFPGTLVFYMGLHRLEQIAEELVDAGKPAATPVAVISQASQPAQRTVVATLVDIGTAVRAAGLRPPSLIVVGDCVRQRDSIAWFERRPLFGLRIGITRPERWPTANGGSREPGVDATLARCLELGAQPVLLPMIAVRPLADPAPIDAVLSRLREFDWLVFTSAQGVRALFDRVLATGRDARVFGPLRLACIGPATAQVLREFSLRADIVPESFRAEDLAAALAPHTRGRRVLWARATRGRDVLPTMLREAGAIVEEVAVYENVDAAQIPPETLEQIERHGLDWIGLSSPSIARQLPRLLPDNMRSRLGQEIRLAAISPVTAQAATAAGLTINATAETFTWDGIFDAIAAAGSRIRPQ
jgi:uroporphyrinogen III methyltransferase/synthase